MHTSLTRRNFLRTSSAALAALSLPRLPAFAATKQRDLKKAIMWSTVKVKGSVLEKMQAVKAAGFLGVEMMGGMDRAEVKAALAATGLPAASVCCHTHWAKPLSHPSADTRKVGYDGLILSLEDAKAYGATSVLLVPGVVKDGVTYQECFGRCVPEIQRAAKIAGELGVKIAIENVWNNFVTTPKQAVELMDAINSPHVGWHFDIGNVGRYSPAEQWVPVLGKRILKLHIKEFNTKAMTDDSPGMGFGAKFLEGTNNWPAIMTALDKVGYTGWGIAEQPGGNSTEGLKDLADRMDKIFAS
jgi:hexulose-6-phosphate isomerase